MTFTNFFVIQIIITTIALAAILYLHIKHQVLNNNLIHLSEIIKQKENQIETLTLNISNACKSLQDFQKYNESQQENIRLKLTHEIEKNLRQIMQSSREQLFVQLRQQQSSINDNLTQLQKVIDKHLISITNQVDQRLNKGFEKNSEIFNDVIKRLILIDQAQEKISKLSTHVTDLQNILSDKQSRGAFGETQLATLVKNVIPEKYFQLQATLSNNKRVDCLLIMPEPTGNIAIDAKFPLENYRNYIKANDDISKKKSFITFKNDVKKHINDISEKYCIPGETSEGVIMYIPAEVIFSEIHNELTDIVEYAHSLKVWIASPTTMMAILHTALSVLKDQATKSHMNTMKNHLKLLGQDFERFQKRMNKLATHISQANDDASQIHTSSQKISRRFEKIDNLELEIEPQEDKETHIEN